MVGRGHSVVVEVGVLRVEVRGSRGDVVVVAVVVTVVHSVLVRLANCFEDAAAASKEADSEDAKADSHRYACNAALRLRAACHVDGASIRTLADRNH